MYGLIECLQYSDTKKQSFEKLFNNSDSKTQFLIRKTIANALKDSPKILEKSGPDWILSTLCSFNKSEEDTMRVFQSIINTFNKIYFGLLNQDIEWRSTNQIADFSIVGLGFFRKRMEILNKRKGSPSVDFYTKAGTSAFKILGYENISENFSGWTNFIEKEFIIDS